jgi:hypothetical protein
MGMGCEHRREDWPGQISEGISEQNQRGFYKRWADLMAGKSWDALVRPQTATAGASTQERGI